LKGRQQPTQFSIKKEEYLHQTKKKKEKKRDLQQCFRAFSEESKINEKEKAK
jgi:hypothetical protein